MVHDEEQRPLTRRQLVDAQPQRRPRLEVERPPRLAGEPVAQILRAPPPGVLDGDVRHQIGDRALERLAIGGPEHRPQRRVPIHQPGEGAAQGFRIHAPEHAGRHRHVVCAGLRRQPLQEPERPLARRQRLIARQRQRPWRREIHGGFQTGEHASGKLLDADPLEQIGQRAPSAPGPPRRSP